MTRLTSGKLAQEAGVGVETIRFYERKGLLQEPARRSGGYRQYDPAAVARVRFIKRAQRLGFTLQEVGELLDLRDDPAADRTEVRTRTRAKIADVEDRIRELQAVRAALVQLADSCCGTGPAAECPIIQALNQVERTP